MVNRGVQNRKKRTFTALIFTHPINALLALESSWNVMAHGDAREGKWRENWRMEWVASTLHTTSEHGVSSITTADLHTSAASSRLNWPPPADLNELVRCAVRRNLVSARVPSHFKRSLPLITQQLYVVIPLGGFLSVERSANFAFHPTPPHTCSAMLYPISSVFPNVIQLARNEFPTLISVRVCWKRVDLCARVWVSL